MSEGIITEKEQAFVRDIIFQAFNRITDFAQNAPEGTNSTLYFLDMVNLFGLSAIGSSVGTQQNAAKDMELDLGGEFKDMLKERINEMFKDRGINLRVIEGLRVVE